MVLRHAPLLSETVRYDLQVKSIGEHLDKTEIKAEISCLALALPALVDEGSLIPTPVFEVSLGFSCPL